MTRIEYDPIGNVRVHCRLSDNSVTVLEADAVVVSVSLGVLKSGYVKESMLGLPRERKQVCDLQLDSLISFEPPLPVEKSSSRFSDWDSVRHI